MIVGSTETLSGVSYHEFVERLMKRNDAEWRVRIDRSYVHGKDIHTRIEAADLSYLHTDSVLGASNPLSHGLAQGRPLTASDIGYISVMKDTVELLAPGDYLTLMRLIADSCIGDGTLSELRNRGEAYMARHDRSCVVILDIRSYGTLPMMPLRSWLSGPLCRNAFLLSLGGELVLGRLI